MKRKRKMVSAKNHIAQSVVAAKIKLPVDVDGYATAPRVVDRPAQRVAVLYFGASWCPPCHAMKRTVLPKLKALGFRVIVFDVDETQKRGKELGIKPLDDHYAIKAMPTCVFVEAALLEGQKELMPETYPQDLGRVRGAEPLKLILAEIAKVEQYLANKQRLGVK